MTIASTRGYFDNVPDGWVAVLFFLPVIALAYLGITHEASRRHYHRVRSRPFMSLFVCCIAGALLGLVAWGCFWFASRPSIKQQHASSMGASQTASPPALQCPVAVTGMSIDPGPYAVGKVVHISLRINSTVSGLKIRLGFFAWAAAITREQLSDPDNRKRLEESMWKQFEDKPPMPKIAVASVRGDVTGVLDWPIPTQEHADRLNGPDGVAYIMGQLDYGDGALDFGGYVRPSNEQMVTFAMEHNGPAQKRFFNSPAPLIESESATTSVSPVPSAGLSNPADNREVPYVYAKLQIDSVAQTDCKFRVQLQNGPIPVRNLRIRFDTDNYHKAESELADRDLGPNGNLSLPGSPLVLETGIQNNLIVTVYYKAKSGDYIARFLFPLSPSDLRPQTVDPETSRYSEGSSPTLEQYLSEELAALKRDSGTLVFPLQEVFENQTIEFRRGDDSRFYVFSAKCMCVLFQTTTEKGRVIKLRNNFAKTKNGQHVITLGWGPNGGRIDVDGTQVRDYDD